MLQKQIGVFLVTFVIFFFIVGHMKLNEDSSNGAVKILLFINILFSLGIALLVI